MTPTQDTFLTQLEAARKRLRKACSAIPEKPLGPPHIIAVSKQQPETRIEEALSAGFRVFGENRVQEAQQRWTARRKLYPDLELHLIGPLQTNKAAAAIALFDVIQTLDREKLALTLASELKKSARAVSCLVQVNTGDEPQKAGISPAACLDFVDFCRHDCGLIVTGLMCIPPLDQPPAPHFALLRSLRDRAGLRHLSMGMSDDYETATRLGATHIRLGTALFGERIGR
jgi:pyridoxal phosphate enzyme (YggS family)